MHKHHTQCECVRRILELLHLLMPSESVVVASAEVELLRAMFAVLCVKLLAILPGVRA